MVKEGGGCLLEGAVFSGTYSISHITAQIFNYLQYTETEGEPNLTMCVTNWKYVY